MDPLRLQTTVWNRGYALLTGKTLTAALACFSRSFTRFALKLLMAKAMVMFAMLGMARYLDTADFGRLAMVLAIGNYWYLPFFTCWGLAYVRFASRKTDVDSSREQLAAALICAALALTFLLPIQILFRQEFSEFLNVSAKVWLYGCIFGILMGIYYFSKNIFQASEEWNLYAACEFIFSASFLIFVVLIYTTKVVDKFFTTLLVVGVAHILGSIIALFRIPLKLNKLPMEQVKNIGIYGIGLWISFSISLLGMQMDKFLLNHYADIDTVGRYQAYYMSTYGILSGFSIILNNYLLPAYGKYGEKTVQQVLQRVLLFLTLPLFAGCLVLGRSAFHLLGGSFGFVWSDLAWASVFSVAAFWLQTEVFFSMTLGKRQLGLNSLAYAIFVGIQLLTMPTLIRVHGVAGAFQGMTAATLSALLIVFSTVTIVVNRGGIGIHDNQSR